MANTPVSSVYSTTTYPSQAPHVASSNHGSSISHQPSPVIKEAVHEGSKPRILSDALYQSLIEAAPDELALVNVIMDSDYVEHEVNKLHVRTHELLEMAVKQQRRFPGQELKVSFCCFQR